MEGIGLLKYADDLRAARDAVLREGNNICWAIFTYEGQSSVLKVSETGDDLEEGIQSLDANKIMYLYARVIDPKSDLCKFVLVNWCGMGAPEMRRAVCAAHIPEVCRFLTKIHVTLNARSEDDLSVEILQQRVSKASGAHYNAGLVPTPSAKPTPGAKPATASALAPASISAPKSAPSPSSSSGYVRPNAAAEIQAADRDKFWGAHDKEDEAARKAEEARRKADIQARIAPIKAAKPTPTPRPKPTQSNGGANGTSVAAAESTKLIEDRRRAELEQQRLEEEARELEKKAAAKRDAEARARSEQTAARVQAQLSAKPPTAATQPHSKNDALDAARDEEERGKRADAAKHARQQEIQALIKARNAQGEIPDEAVSKRADAMRAQRQEEIRKMMSSRDAPADDDEHRHRAEQLRLQREQEIQQAFAKRSNTFDEDENERRKRAEEMRNKRQEEIRQMLGSSAATSPSAIASARRPSNPPAPAAMTVQAPAPAPAPAPTPAPAPAPAPAQAAKASNEQPQPISNVAVKQPIAPIDVERTASQHDHESSTVAVAVPVEVVAQPVVQQAAEKVAVQQVPALSPPSHEPPPFDDYEDEDADADAAPSALYENVTVSKSSANDTNAHSKATAQLPQQFVDEPKPEQPAADLYVPVVVSAAVDQSLYENQMFNSQDTASNVADSYEPVSFGAKRSSFQRANTDYDNEEGESGQHASSNSAPAEASGAAVRALYDYDAQDEDEISFAVDEIITDVQEIDSGWWLGTNQAGHTGMFPANYVAMISNA